MLPFHGRSCDPSLSSNAQKRSRKACIFWVESIAIPFFSDEYEINLVRGSIHVDRISWACLKFRQPRNNEIIKRNREEWRLRRNIQSRERPRSYNTERGGTSRLTGSILGKIEAASKQVE
jgi:hypothetical protein